MPEDLVEVVGPFRVAMQGTSRAAPRCVALTGTVGEDACCGIYALRPSPCREFTASWADGQPEPRCDEARARHGLPPLRPEDWQGPRRPRGPRRAA